MADNMTRRDFVAHSAAAAGVAVIGVGGAGAKEYDASKVLNYNERMEYRRLGKTGLMVSAICLGGHWKRLGTVLGSDFVGEGYNKQDYDNVNASGFILFVCLRDLAKNSSILLSPG